MATAEEKQAKQDALDASKQAVVQGQQRLQTEVGKAAGAFPVRRLRSAGDLSRYAVGGFLSDPNAITPGATKPPPTPVPTGSGTGGGSGSGVKPPPRPVPVGTLPPIGTSGTRPPSSGIVGEWRGGGGKPAGRAMGGGQVGTPGRVSGSGTGTTKANQTLSGGSARDLSGKELSYINRSKGVTPTRSASSGPSGKRAGGGATAAAKAKAKAKAKGTGKGTTKSNATLKGGAARDYGKKELGAINRAKGAAPKPKAKVKSSGTGNAAKRRAM